jgi:uncharacterized ubiquitin-like protein YukD
MEYINKKNLDENIYVIIGTLIVVVIGMYLMGFYNLKLSSYYPFKGLIDNQIAREDFIMLNRNYNYYGNKFIKMFKERIPDIKEDYIPDNILYPILTSIVNELWEELSKKPEAEKMATFNMFIKLNTTINDLDKDKIKETLKHFYSGPLPNILNNNKQN